jgi:hypothetical protein
MKARQRFDRDKNLAVVEANGGTCRALTQHPPNFRIFGPTFDNKIGKSCQHAFEKFKSASGTPEDQAVQRKESKAHA